MSETSNLQLAIKKLIKLFSIVDVLYAVAEECRTSRNTEQIARIIAGIAFLIDNQKK